MTALSSLLSADPFPVSVVIALYNKRGYIQAALRSIQAQTLAATEIIVVDDGSTDGSAAAVMAMDIPNLRLVHTAHVGPGPARNRGMSLARSDYVAFLDGDDLWLPNHLETLARVAGAFPDAALIATDYRQFIGTPPTLENKAIPAEPRPLSFFDESRVDSRVWTGSVVVKRDKALALRGFGDFVPGEDRMLWQAMALHAQTAVVDQVTALYRRETGGIMEQVAATEVLPTDIPPHMRQIDAYLANHPDTGLVPSIVAYLREEWISMLRQYLYRQHMESARWALRQMRARNIAAPTHLALLASLPRPAVAALVAVHRMRRRLLTPRPPAALPPHKGDK